MGYGEEHSWTQVSGLWRLPYINDLLLPHNIDAMHTEKNWGEALFGTVMDIPDKTKDNIKARVDLATLCDRPRYEMKTPRSGRQWRKTPTDFVLTRPQKKGSTRVDPKVTISRWVCSESEEGSQFDYNVNQWAEES